MSVPKGGDRSGGVRGLVLGVTGTSTDVGKTVVTAALAVRLAGGGRRVVVLKPGQTGVADDEPGDAAAVTALTGMPALELRRYPEPLAPDVAARRSGRPTLTLAEVVAEARRLAGEYDVVLVEGAGGLLVRLGAEGFTLRDVAAELGASVVVVSTCGLGSLNHAALTVEALRFAGVRCPGVVIGAWPAEPDLATRCNVADLPEVTGVPLLGRLPAGSGRLAPADFVRVAEAALPAANIARLLDVDEGGGFAEAGDDTRGTPATG